ncbi:AAA family ATPase [Actinoplanes sp. NPDC023936]|uniref:AAA family ATPase n=1 Tax=Actinoplanes sp. NPDC023936 TaxID=3154910 RepID=UPI0033C691C3
MTLPRQDARAKPRNDPPASAIDPAVSNPAALRIDEQTVLGWFLHAANHTDARACTDVIGVRHFYNPAHQEIYSLILVHAGAPNILALVTADLSGPNMLRSIRALPGGVASYLSECMEYAHLLGPHELGFHMGRVIEAHQRRRRFEIHARATKALEADDLDAYEAAQDEMRDLANPAASDSEDRFPEIDWDEAFAIDFSQMDWLPGRFMERGQQVTVVGDGKVGKSLFLLDWVVRAVTGRAFLGDDPRPPIRVLYFDRENSLRDIVTRARALGASPDDLRGRLMYRQFPRFSGALDESSTAAREFLGIVDAVMPDVVILDTASRFIAGKENDADTWLQLYQLIHAPLKARGVACVRLDHFGKDSDRGSRGSSAKTQDVDHVWEMRRVDERKQLLGDVERVATTISMRRTHTRSGLGEDEFTIVRRGEKRRGGMWLDGRTGHQLAEAGALDSIRAEVDRIVDDLLAKSVPPNLGRDRLKGWMTLKQIPTFNNALMADVVRELKVRQGDLS